MIYFDDTFWINLVKIKTVSKERLTDPVKLASLLTYY